MDMQREYPFEFSVVMAVYNVEPWLREAVESVIGQDFGFEKIQLIMVDDGSTDGSGAICDEYAAQYPENVLVIHKENGGASSARNAGVKIATGRYLNFLDPDDWIDHQVLSAVYDFFLDHEDEIDVVAIPIMMFGSWKGPHPANSKFKQGDRIIDLDAEWWHLQMSLAASFLKADVAKTYCFKEDLAMASAEDSKELIKLILRNSKLGVVDQGNYNYRKREGSLIATGQQNPLWYTPYLRDYSQWAIDYSMQQLGYVPKNIQYTIMYDLQWRLRQQEIPAGILSDEEISVYLKELTEILHHIDDDVVMCQKNIWTEHKAYILTTNHGYFPKKIRFYSSDVLFAYDDIVRFRLSDIPVTYEFVRLNKESITVEGWMRQHSFLDREDPELIVKANGVEVHVESIERPEVVEFAGQVIAKRIGFQFTVSLCDIESVHIEFLVRTQYGDVPMRQIQYGKYFPIDNKMFSNYYFKENWKLTRNRKQLVVSLCGRKGHLLSELKFYKELLKSKKTGSKKAIVARIVAQIIRKFKRKKIWLVCDKSNRADDNGEAFFKYLQTKRSPDRKTYFLIGKDSADYKRMSKVGKVIPYMSWRHKLLFLVSDYIISAYSHDELNNPFWGYHTPYRDLMQNCRYIFLQHGIIKDDLSKGLNRSHKNMYGFVTSTKAEWQSIVDTPSYLYSPQNIWLTGLPRYDYLYHAEKREIAIMPTWRQPLFGAYHAEDSRWDLKPGFEESDYYQFYEGLINSRRLLEAAAHFGYKINFVPHPVLFPYIDRFSAPNEVTIWGADVIYRKMFAVNKLLITDFSSVAFDFAYLRKPVIYAHFDTNHYKEGYFDYERDGFGEVEYDLEGTIDRIIEYMKNDCQLKEKYQKRIDQFFAFNDQNNCQRVYEKIMELEGKA